MYISPTKKKKVRFLLHHSTWSSKWADNYFTFWCAYQTHGKLWQLSLHSVQETKTLEWPEDSMWSDYLPFHSGPHLLPLSPSFIPSSLSSFPGTRAHQTVSYLRFSALLTLCLYLILQSPYHFPRTYLPCSPYSLFPDAIQFNYYLHFFCLFSTVMKSPWGLISMFYFLTYPKCR
jgi:hypothetical protein